MPINHSDILRLTEPCDPREAGGKGAGLQRLVALDAPVPAGFVISASATARLDEDGVAADVWDRIVAAWRALDAPVVIVRSSAVGEDSSAASFAGQLESISDVRDAQQLRDAILRCSRSCRSGRVRSYEQSRGQALTGMAIVVQRQIDAMTSGVLFTEDPGDSASALIEYCDGAGEALVSGRIEPVRIAVSKDGTVRHLAGHATRMLSSDEARALAREGDRIAAEFGAPQDIEWTIDSSGTWWIVQARPITTRARERVAPRQVLWSNANVNENFPGPITPLLYSVAAQGYYHYFRNLGRAFGLSRRRLNAIEQPLGHIIGVHNARMYYNLTSIHTVLRAAPFGEALAASFNEFVGADRLAAKDDDEIADRTRASRLSQSLELVRIAACVCRQYARLSRRVAEFERTADEFASATDPSSLPRLGRAELLRRLRQFMEIRNHRWKNASLADAASMVCFGALKTYLQRAKPDEDQAALHTTLLKSLPGLVSSKPAIELWKLSREIRADSHLTRLFEGADPKDILTAVRSDPAFADFRVALDRYLAEWGFRCSAELMLTAPSFQEDATPLMAMLQSYARSEGESPERLLERQRDERLQQTARIMREIGWRRAPVLRVLLRWTQRAIRLRERARLKQALLYSRLRRIALAIGDLLAADGRLDRPDEVFMLAIDELDALLAGAAMFPDSTRDLTRLRRAAHEQVGAAAPPDTFVLPEGAYLRDVQSSTSDPSADPAALTGTTACGGRSTARATVLSDVTEAHRLTPGDILVTRQTDPGWGPVFPLISGLVIERGGMLSHGAIIAREFGIPSIVGVNDATRRIPSGALVCLDADRGIVRLVAEGA